MMRFWRWYRKNDQIFTIGLTIVAIAMLFMGIFLFAANKQDPNSNATLETIGYQPVYIQTGSMEPTIKTKAIVLIKRVDSMSEIAIDDVITYRVYDEAGNPITITHRVYNIKDDGTIITKGDNNRVADNYSITIDNVLAKVVRTWNWAADIQNALATTSGKILAGVALLIIILIFVGLGSLGQYLDEKYGVNEDVEVTVNDRIKMEAYDFEEDFDFENWEGEDIEDSKGTTGTKRAVVNTPQLLDTERRSWEQIYYYKVSDDNLLTITGIKPNFTSLAEITIPKEIKHKKVVGIGPFAFKNSRVTIVHLPDTLETIEKAAFYQCEDLLYVEIPSSVKSIGANAFDGCKSMIDIKLPVNLTKIEDKAFFNCTSLSVITINEKITSIGDSAFYGCDNLNTIYGMKGVFTIKLNAFKTNKLVETNIITDNPIIQNYAWSLYGRTPNFIADQSLLDMIQEENKALNDEYEKHQEELRLQKEQQLTTKIGRQIAKFGERKNIKEPEVVEIVSESQENTFQPISEEALPFSGSDEA